jgi:hypothetical protein
VIGLAAIATAVALQVTPQVAMAPATVTVRVTVTSDDERPRDVAIVMTSADGEARSSTLPLDPQRRRQTVWFQPWRRVPPGDYEVLAAVLDAGGHVLAQQRTTVQIKGNEP